MVVLGWIVAMVVLQIFVVTTCLGLREREAIEKGIEIPFYSLFRIFFLFPPRV